ncbi:metal ABC transporter ATP-binding protein [Enterococcus hulanensis]|uniref:Metal ABC transporter ATP-binding protein n=1 Tax=Enterococcus hulanensis TaxID=2559929 RepID=A0ABU3EYD7_9ENTE|nr:metal ABC transporter ATP-binding protein [Enterococcus hulanensis]MDT2599870.1 metal ABC transporter ATP-binding protein [Enterococcus hulanensis]MDT2609944.1 metal ABC transporter ATP-binding protein [Enterococcus hulanensis]MDT2617751.1 metal ABC transporter ATP-binding protein [Enterococcus hulanensis]MDT2630648.1 metal ABC transporter ATP-binding protein [Enterococcus hulanensis]MDT2656316.1 metal ABC transporter ATP-binding protein [Enterococcus hulanensis]
MKTIRVENLSVAYRGKIALQHVNLELSAGKLTGIVGPNGAGKSTLMKGILQLIKTQSGKIFYGEEPINNQRQKIAYVEQRQDIDLSFPIDVLGVVVFGTYPHLKIFQRPGKQEKKLAAECLEKVGLSEFSDRQISELSGGQLQRVFIARALAQQAEWILLDEPFAGIDATSEKIIIDLLKELRDEGKSIVIVHHDLHKVTDYFDEVILLNKGLIASGPVAQTYTTKNMEKTYGSEIAQTMRVGGVDFAT